MTTVYFPHARTAHKYVTNPNTKMKGGIVAAILESLNYNEYKDIVDPVLQSYMFNPNEPDRLYPAQALLDVYKIMEEHPNAMFNFVAIGKQVAESLEFPPSVTSIPEAIATLNSNYKTMLVDFDESEFYNVKVIEQRRLQIRDNNPYPHDMVFGYIYTLVNRFLPEGTVASIKRIYDNPDNPNTGGATYDVTWEPSQ